MIVILAQARSASRTLGLMLDLFAVARKKIVEDPDVISLRFSARVGKA